MQSEIGRKKIGEEGERRAAKFLRRRGMRIVEVNHRTRLGEIDIIAEEGDTVVFVEVKSKRGSLFGRPEEMVTPAKRRRLTILAHSYIRYRRWQGRPARFDVVAIEYSDEGVELRYYRSAFLAEER